MRIIFIQALLCLVCCSTRAQNNDIFNGGNNDGWQQSSFAQPENGIFNGGNGDGWYYVSYQQAANAIYQGGSGDGWASTSFLQTGNAIFNGGAGDGWHVDTAESADNAVFTGGVGDGWANTYRPMGSLPVTFIGFTARKQSDRAALLEWQTSQEINSRFFVVESSTDALNFQTIGQVAAAGNSNQVSRYSFVDLHPAAGFNHYRLKQVDTDGSFVYTPVRSVHFDQLNAASIKYFPNPTNGLLNVEMPGALENVPKLVNIVNSNGLVLQQLKLSNSGSLIQLDFSRYPKGVYFVQLRCADLNSTHRIVLQ